MSDIDLDKYRHHLERFDLPEDRKVALLKAVRRIMQSFVDRAFGDDPVQQARQSAVRGSLEDTSDTKDVSASPTVLDSLPSTEKETDKSLSGAFRDRGSGGGGKE